MDTDTDTDTTIPGLLEDVGPQTRASQSGQARFLAVLGMALGLVAVALLGFYALR